MPIEPMKVLAVVAIAQHWSPSMVYASGFAMGIIWIVFAVSGIMGWIAKVTPQSVIHGIQISLGVLLAVEAIKMISTWWVLGVLSVLIALVFARNRYAPAAIILMALGITIMFVKGQFGQVDPPRLGFPKITGFRIDEVWHSLILAGFAQIPLTATNAVIATSSLIKTYWPEKPVSENRLSLNTGIMNVIFPFLGGIPLCHGAGGLAGQYYFGARTGGTNIIEGSIEIALGLFLAGSIAALFTIFPTAIIGAMMLMVGIELTKLARGIRWGTDIISIAATLVVSLSFNMAYGFLAGFVVYYVIRFVLTKKHVAGPVDRE
jgi:xanthine/uracil/vitamin C permease (AzgA family)